MTVSRYRGSQSASEEPALVGVMGIILLPKPPGSVKRVRPDRILVADLSIPARPFDILHALSPLNLWRYLGHLTLGRFILWGYFLWWIVVLIRYFDPHPQLWLTSLGLGVIIGAALYINTSLSGRSRVKLEPWPTFRLFLTPFCVSSFAALVKGRGFFLIFSPDWREMAVALAAWAVLGALARLARRQPAHADPPAAA